MKLIYTATQETVKIGDVAMTHNGEAVTVAHMIPPHKPGSTGRVGIRKNGENYREYFPSVIGAEWIAE